MVLGACGRRGRGVPLSRPRAAGWLGVADDSPLGLHALPCGVLDDGAGRGRVAVAVGDRVLDLTAVAPTLLPQRAGVLAGPTLDPFLAAGPDVWAEVRAALQEWLAGDEHRDVLEPALHRAADVDLRLPFTVSDYVDFYSSEQHATNAGRIFRPDAEPLYPNWKAMPVGYHGRSATVVASGTPVVRPCGQRRGPDGTVTFGPSTRLDIEAEVGFVVGVPSALGRPVPLADADRHVFGVCLVNDWSARDIQGWETVPLGPFLGKSFATSVSPWVVPLAALEPARVPPPARDAPLLPYLDDAGERLWGLDLRLEVRLNGQVVSRPPFRTMYWTAAQQLAHLTSNGACVRTGDLFASGTVSGPSPDELGSLLELSWNGTRPLALADGTTRTFLEDGDEVTISATAPGPDGAVVGLGEVRGRILPSAG